MGDLACPGEITKAIPIASCKVRATGRQKSKKKGSVETPPVHTKTTQRENRLWER
jgi:hypothetical protein